MNSCENTILPSSLLSWRLDRELPLNVENTQLCTKSVIVVLPLHRPEGKDKEADIQLIEVKVGTLKNVVQAIYDFYQMPLTMDDLAQMFSSSAEAYHSM